MTDSAPPPRPRRRRLIGEFLVVMLGVLSALALEQMVLDWQERGRVAATRAAIDSEIVDFGGVFALRAEASPCIATKLDAIEAAIAGDALPRLADVGRPPYFFASRSAWSGNAPELVSRHHGAETARTYGEIHEGIGEYATLALREQELWALLQSLESSPIPADPARVWRLREAVVAARNANVLLTAIAAQMDERARGVLAGRPLAPAPQSVAARPICLPLRVVGAAAAG